MRISRSRNLTMFNSSRENWWCNNFGLLIFLSFCTGHILAGPGEDKLLQYLFNDGRYNPISRPVANDSGVVEIKFKMEMQQILDVDETREILQSTQWLHFEWNDYRLTWEPKDYDGINVIILKIENLWKPDVVLYNTVDEDVERKLETNAYVNSTGHVIWIPIGVFWSSCAINIEWFPFDTQICKMKFGSWTYGSDFLNLTLLSDKIDISTYQHNGEWDLITADATRNELLYDCCPLPFLDITFTIGLRRRPGFYLLNVLIPCTFVSILTLFNFLQAPDSGEKIGLGITIMLSLSVFQLIIADMIPRTSTTIPIIGAYFCGVMCLCTISLIMTLLTLKCHFTKPEMHKMPEWLRIAVCEWLSWFLRMQRPGKRITKKYLKQQWSSRRARSQNRSFKTPVDWIPEPVNVVALMADETSTGSAVFNIKEESNNINHKEEMNNTHHNEEMNNVQGNENQLTCDLQNSVPFYAMAAQDLESLRYELRSILNEVKCVTKKIQEDEATGSEVNEWQFAALVVDRLCFWICTVMFTIGTLCVFIYAPQQ